MCGICGVAYADPHRPVAKDLVLRMRERILHRGPDDAGIYLRGNVGFGHRRLSIIDVAGGHQPLANEDQTIWITFNGEIYNFRELRELLAGRGHRFRTRTDTECIVHLYEEFGLDGVARLNGMFAFALWDQRAERLMLARDRMGIKPLYYWIRDGSILLAPEIKALLAHPAIRPVLDLQSLREYLPFRYPGGDRTFFEGVRSLEPGHVLVWERGKCRKQKYWFMKFPGRCDEGSWVERTKELDALLNDAVRLRLVSEVPLGTYLSGGVDSSLITAYAARHYGSTLNTFSVGFEERDYDESRYAAMVAEHCGTRHHRLVVTERLFAEALPKAIWLHDAPLNHANSIPLYLLSQVAKRDVTVMLAGEGSDELFGGYPRYRIIRARETLARLPAEARRAVGQLLLALPPERLRKIGRALWEPVEGAVVANAQFVDEALIRMVCSHNGESIDKYRFEILGSTEISETDAVGKLLYLDLKTYLVSLLDRQDKMSMGAGIESRLPFLDYRVVQWSLGLAGRTKIGWLRNKAIIKSLASRYLPRTVVHRKKSGFGVPIGQWLRNEHGLGRYLDVLRSRRCLERGIWDRRQVERLLDEHMSGKRDHADLLWELINVELWCGIYIDRAHEWDSASGSSEARPEGKAG